MYLTEDDEYWLWDKVLERMPKTAIMHARKIAPNIAMLFDFNHDRGETSMYKLTTFRLDSTQGARWVKALSTSREHRFAVKWTRTQLTAHHLHELVDKDA